MGDLVTRTVEGTLYWLSLPELTRIRRLGVDVVRRTALLADACRLNALYIVSRGGSLRAPSGFTSLDLVTWLHENELHGDESTRDVYFSSKGHDAPALYSVLIALERLPFAELHRLRRSDGVLAPGEGGSAGTALHGTSLGMGISRAKGLILGDRLRGIRRRVFALTGAAELGEGQIWESLGSAVDLGLHEIVAIVDHPALEAGRPARALLGDLPAKFQAFGWHVERVDGHDLAAFAAVLERIREVRLPKAIIADTRPEPGLVGASLPALDAELGSAALEHSILADPSYARVADAIIERLNQRCQALGVARLAFESARPPRRSSSLVVQRLGAAYSQALLDEMRVTPELIAVESSFPDHEQQLGAREAYPQRFVDCGAAEMDMVSMAGGLALSGLIPVCHSPAEQLSTRANDPIYENAREQARIVYVASLAGVLPGSVEQGHRAVRDISALGAVPDLVAIAPCCEIEVTKAFHWCVHEHRGSSWLRLESVPWAVPFELPSEYRLELGVGTTLRPGSDAVFIAYGPVLLTEAYLAAERLAESGLSVAVVNLPWLNRVHAPWLSHTVSGFGHVFSLDNHYPIGGQGDRIAEVMARAGFARWPRLHRCAIETVPGRGSNADVLHHHGLDAASLHDRVLGAVRSGRTR
jgi:transketolase